MFFAGPGADVIRTEYGSYTFHQDYFHDFVYAQAHVLCRSLGAEMAAFESKAEFDALQPSLKVMQIFLNANDRRNPGMYTQTLVK